jgi:putative transposase
MGENQGQILTSTLRLPDSLQVDAARLLEAARQSVNAMLERLWPRLGEFGQGSGPAWKQVTSLLERPNAYPDRVWRCEAETAGRILRSQAARKAAFDSLQPILGQALIIPAEGRCPARKNRREVCTQITALREKLGGDADQLLHLLNVAEQACNFYLEHEHFPQDYFTLQGVPMLCTGLLTFAGDDGPSKGQAYRLAVSEGA